MNIRFCSCGTSVGDAIQLLRIQWFPASFKKPRTAFTFAVLDQFHALTLQSKVAAYDFYLALERITNNTGSITLQVILLPIVV